MRREIRLPRQMLVEAVYESHALKDVAGETVARLDASMRGVELKGKRIAVGVGSRGIDQLSSVVSAAIDYLKGRGASVFIVPAMGSHGAATAEGQRDVLATLGVTEESAGAPIRAEMETDIAGKTERGLEVHLARPLRDADVVLIINRVKPHTDFASELIGSGVQKMSVIGLGKTNGAFVAHRAARRYGYESVLLEISAFALRSLPSVFGLALIEDAHHRLSKIEAIPGEILREREPQLLKLSKDWMPVLPFDKIDLLIVDQIGKNISGAGMDTNIIGRDVDGLPRSDRRSDIKAIYARGLTPETHGNAIGMGFADVVSSRLVAEIEPQSTFMNALSGLAPATVRTPMHFPSDVECLNAAFRLKEIDGEAARIVWIRNTLALDRFIASTGFEREIADRSNLKILHPPVEWKLSDDGNFDPPEELVV